jgi:hypothetical protein
MFAWAALALMFAEPGARASIAFGPQTHVVCDFGAANSDIERPSAQIDNHSYASQDE